VDLLEEFWNQSLANLSASPLTAWERAVGLVALGLLKNLFSPLTSGWSKGFTTSAVILYFGRRLRMLARMAGFALAPFSAVYYPADVLPGWARAVSYGLPMTYVFQCMRAVLNGRPTPVDYLLISFALNIVYLTAAISFFGWMFRKGRDRGFGRLD
jgi:ABC-2 type transport system permease protein